MPTPNPCAREAERTAEAERDLEDARADLSDAWDKYWEETSPWDESTWVDVGSVAGVLGACALTLGLGCGLAVLGGGLLIVGSEIDRWREIADAERELHKAQRDFMQADAKYWSARNAELHCKNHNDVFP